MKEHQQADILRAIADGKTIQTRYVASDWFDVEPNKALVFLATNCDSSKIRIKPETLLINSHEVHEPVREPLKDGQAYWVPDLRYYGNNNNGDVDNFLWSGRTCDLQRLAAGVIHLTKEAAIAHAEALLSFTRSNK